MHTQDVGTVYERFMQGIIISLQRILADYNFTKVQY